MWTFYRRVIISAVKQFWSTTDKAIAGTAVLLFFIGVFNRRIAEWAVTTWNGISPWWSLAPIGVVGGYRLLKANYEQFAALEKRCHSLEETKDTRHTQEVMHLTLSNLIREPSGLHLRLRFVESADEMLVLLRDVISWYGKTHGVLQEFGMHREAALFATSGDLVTLLEFDRSDLNQGRKHIREYLDSHQQELRRIVERLTPLP